MLQHPFQEIFLDADGFRMKERHADVPLTTESRVFFKSGRRFAQGFQFRKQNRPHFRMSFIRPWAEQKASGPSDQTSRISHRRILLFSLRLYFRSSKCQMLVNPACPGECLTHSSELPSIAENKSAFFGAPCRFWQYRIFSRASRMEITFDLIGSNSSAWKNKNLSLNKR